MGQGYELVLKSLRSRLPSPPSALEVSHRPWCWPCFLRSCLLAQTGWRPGSPSVCIQDTKKQQYSQALWVRKSQKRQMLRTQSTGCKSGAKKRLYGSAQKGVSAITGKSPREWGSERKSRRVSELIMRRAYGGRGRSQQQCGQPGVRSHSVGEGKPRVSTQPDVSD